MSVSSETPQHEVVGYLPRWTVRDGEVLELKVSTTAPTFEYDVVKLCGSPERTNEGPHQAAISEFEAASGIRGSARKTVCGSYGEVTELQRLGAVSAFTVAVNMYPTADTGRQQVVLALARADGRPDAELILAADMRLNWVLHAETGELGTAATVVPLKPRSWYQVAASWNRLSGAVSLKVSSTTGEVATEPVPGKVLCRTTPSGWQSLRIAATVETDELGMAAGGFYNGKIEGLTLRPGDPGETQLHAQVLAQWDFSQEIGTWNIRDVGPAGCHGHLVNAPTRAVTGMSWRGEEFRFAHALDQYGAIHFHEDDLDDVRWPTDAEISVPATARSGIYAVRIRSGGASEEIPFFLAPRRGDEARVAFLVPTFTYLAYANERIATDRDFRELGISGRAMAPDWRRDILARHPEYGLSLYSCHLDGSGVCLSSMRRPVLTMKSDYIGALAGGPRMLAADLFIPKLLDRNNIKYDVITDDDLDRLGWPLLDPYDVVLTGAHPEYASLGMLDALTTYLSRGRGFVYMGGNGFYWVASQDNNNCGLVEVRRGYPGGGTWEGYPGEAYHATTGELGGRWRHRGRSPNVLTGVGFTSQGWDEKAPGFRITPDGRRPEAAFIFNGVKTEGIIGDYGQVMGGAAGYEIDRADAALGTPGHALIVATSQGLHSDYYQLTVEDVDLTSSRLGGQWDDRVRADMTYFRTPEGGSVFSVASLSFSGSLPVNDYDNDCARIVLNVVREFLSRGEQRSPERPGALDE